MAEPFSPATGKVMLVELTATARTTGPVYVVPGPLPAGWDLLLEANLVRHETNGTASPVEYNLVKILSGSVPANLTFASTGPGSRRTT